MKTAPLAQECLPMSDSASCVQIYWVMVQMENVRHALMAIAHLMEEDVKNAQSTIKHANRILLPAISHLIQLKMKTVLLTITLRFQISFSPRKKHFSLPFSKLMVPHLRVGSLTVGNIVLLGRLTSERKSRGHC